MYEISHSVQLSGLFYFIEDNKVRDFSNTKSSIKYKSFFKESIEVRLIVHTDHQSYLYLSCGIIYSQYLLSRLCVSSLIIRS